jgi:hypothetical protein
MGKIKSFGMPIRTLQAQVFVKVLPVLEVLGLNPNGTTASKHRGIQCI